ncbi:hypothetical protein QN366_01595 [Pseudomonas sp. CCC3.2]|uniref:head-tail joining protein n=1 Tax=unclassified Pseudomonas TaxID=196821 RepID=UPI002AB44680|nr:MULTISPECIES: hypothetical protein [unclassified Pseudomonas]MDY7560215.1 hypothetical protein [Pseudomonas sp. AB6]MEB0178764.1 hypothetical protein [Pseudomonas sp. CCC3.2]MEB0211402.1 hypothetical protein [Pseudomonas sp. AB6]
MIDWDSLVLAPLADIFGEGNLPDSQIMFYPDGGTAYAIDGVFDAAYRDIHLIDTMVDANTVQPVLGVRLAIFAAPPIPDDQVFIPSTGNTYLIKEVRPDSHGWAKLMLGKM